MNDYKTIAESNNFIVLEKFYKGKPKFGSIINCYQGELNISTQKKYFTINKNKNLLIKGVQVQKYFTTMDVSQGVIEYVKKKEYLLDVNTPKSKHHQQERIVMQGINNLDKCFYTELLHIIGLAETTGMSKKLIERKISNERNSGSLLENTIDQLITLDKITRLEKAFKHSANEEDNLFNVALELVITWINRILFLKLLESQQLNYHNGDDEYSFLNIDKVADFDELNTLFFSVLAKLPKDRNSEVKQKYKFVPFLNSSLFEPTELEHSCLFIGQLNEKKLPILSSTVLKDTNGGKRIGELGTLEYLFEFLNAYDFSSEGSKEIQEEDKTLINASVLGLIFEKINGYKDGSFFTPGFITMHMCRETIRRAVIQKFNEEKNWNIGNFVDLYNKIENVNDANKILNNFKICDPAVGSGHFLVSALNEIISIKSELNIITDKSGKKIKGYNIEVVNDELIITNEEGDPFTYNPRNKESQRIQETLFNEKQTIIENCLFGVDINQNSVNICRLRLWIELLKNAYYTEESNFTELETLPNIDINIKCGNSLISRFDIGVDIKKELKKKKWTIENYKNAVFSYKNASSKEATHDMEKLIFEIKTDFEMEVTANDKRKLKLEKLLRELEFLKTQGILFESSKKEQYEMRNKVKSLEDEITQIEYKLEDIKKNELYRNAFEWRFEFPEVLNDEGDFVGFDVIIGNPPYINVGNLIDEEKNFYMEYYETALKRFDIYIAFIEKGIKLLKESGKISFIIPYPFLTQDYGQKLRKYMLDNSIITNILDLSSSKVFENATVKNIIFIAEKVSNEDARNKNKIICSKEGKTEIIKINQTEFYKTPENMFRIDAYSGDIKIINKIQIGCCPIGKIAVVSWGARGVPVKDFHLEKSINSKCKKMVKGKDIRRYSTEWNNKWLLYDLSKLYRPAFPELFESEKLFISKVTGETGLIATYDDLQYYSDDSLNCLILKYQLENKEKEFWGRRKITISKEDFELSRQYNIKYILGILNSKMMNYYFNNYLGYSLNVYPESLEQIPIKILNDNNIILHNEIVKLVENVLKLNKDINNKSKNSTTIKAIESQIDDHVFKLYGLSKEEKEFILSSSK